MNSKVLSWRVHSDDGPSLICLAHCDGICTHHILSTEHPPSVYRTPTTMMGVVGTFPLLRSLVVAAAELPLVSGIQIYI